MVRVMSTPTVQSVESPDSGQARIPEAERILIESNVSPEISSNQEENVSSSDDNVCSSDTSLPNGIDQQTSGLVTSIRISNSVSNTSSLPNGIRHESSESATCSGVSTSISSDTVSSYPNCSEIRNRHRRRHSSGEQVLAERRRSRNSLQMPDSPRWDWSNHNHFRSHPFEGQENSEIANEGRDLFLGFVQNELERNHLQVPECLTPENTQEDVSLVSQSLAHNNLIAYGRDLRRMADDFAQSEQRRRLRIRAEQMQIESLDVDNFTQILIGLFEEGGVTWERVLVLFFFCSDVAIVALRRKIDQYFHKLIEWSLRFIMSKMSAWVQQNGGWAAVLSQSMNMLYRTAIIGFCAVGIVAMALYIKNNWK